MNFGQKLAQFLMVIVLALVTAPGTIFAASFDLVQFSTTPKTPGVNENVLVRMESFAVTLSTANITWFVNKEPIKDGVAETSLTVQTGDFGNRTVIDVVITTSEGLLINKQFIIAPAEVDVLWEAQTYTPPFYKGKALPSYKSMVRVTAIPRFNAASSNPADYFYKWTYNRTMGAGESLGGNSILIPVGYAGSPLPVNVETSLPGTDWKGAKYIAIPVVETKVELYEQAPLLGTRFHHALKATTETAGTEFTVHAVPYFFSLDNMTRGDIAYRWNVDLQARPVGIDPLNYTLVKMGEDVESRTISFSAQNPKRILQEGRKQGSISFTSQK